MAYADQGMSSRRITAIVVVALLHALLGYAFVTGLALNVATSVIEDLKTFDVEEAPPPPPEEPPPPPEQVEAPPPPVVSPPPIVRTPTIIAPPVTTVRVAPPPVITPQAPVAPPPPPPPPVPTVSKAAGARGNPADWITNNDYPSSAIRDEAEGVSGIAWDINEQGRVENCVVTATSGNSALDEAACRLITRRGRYTAALDQNGQPIRSKQSRRVRWQLPEN